MTMFKRFLTGSAGVGVLLAGSSLFTAKRADAHYCMPNMYPPGVWTPVGTCAPGCEGQLLQNQSGGTYCFIPKKGF